MRLTVEWSAVVDSTSESPGHIDLRQMRIISRATGNSYLDEIMFPNCSADCFEQPSEKSYCVCL